MKDYIEVIKMAMVDLPKMTESQNKKGWVNYGDDNLFPDYLIDLSNRSALHNAILQSKIDYIVGDGLEVDEMANKNEKYSEVYRKCASDLSLFGGYAINVIWGKGGTKIAEIYHLDFSKVRASEPNERGTIDTFFYSKNWENLRKYSEVPIIGYDPNNNKGENASQCLYYKPYRPGNFVYPLPSYIGALTYVNIDCEISNFHLANLKNGMAPSMMINFTNGEPEQEAKRDIENKINNKFSGTDNVGKSIFTWSDGVDRIPVVTTLQTSQLPQQFVQIQAQVLQNILSGHQLTSPLLAGISTPGSLGSNQELLTAYQIYSNNIIQPMRNELAVSFDKVSIVNDTEPLVVVDNAPIEFTFTEQTLLQILTKEELRNMVGYEPIVSAPIQNNPIV